jgi:hypothetical protein
MDTLHFLLRRSAFAAQMRTDGNDYPLTSGGKENLMEISYTLVGDYYLPNLTLSDPPDAPPLGRYGMMHKAYLREEKPALYAELLLTERLYPFCREVEQSARLRRESGCSEEVILTELVYC